MRQTYDSEKVSFNFARLKKNGQTFEIVVDPDLAIKFKKEKPENISEAVKSEHIFRDAQKGELAKAEEFSKVFDTSDELKICEEILFNGEIQLSQEYRDKLREEKKKRIIELIHRNSFNPKTETVHPIQRIENAFQEVNIRVDEHKSANEQLNEIVKLLRPVLPISFEQKTVELIIPSVHAGKCYSQIKQAYEPEKEDWLSDGSLKVVVKAPIGLINTLLDNINSITHGDAEINIR